MSRPRAEPARGLVLGAALLLGAGMLAGALRWRDPHVPGSWGLCPWLVATGTPCPTCGGLRALADLLAGRPGAALAHHAYLVVSLGIGVGIGIGIGVAAGLALLRRAGAPGSGLRLPPRERRGVAGWLWPTVAWLTGLVLFGVLRAVNPAWWPPLGAA